jgi:hypothetical protein
LKRISRKTKQNKGKGLKEVGVIEKQRAHKGSCDKRNKKKNVLLKI